jgi:hypothetical protein
MRRAASLIGLLLLSAAPASAAGTLDLNFGTAPNPGGSTATFTQTTVTAAPDADGFVGATVLSAVNVRSAPSSTQSEIIGTLQQGQAVRVRCDRGWCEIEDTGGFTAQKFLNFDGGAQSFDTVNPPANPATMEAAVNDPGTTPPAQTAPAAAGFDGLWTPLDASGQPGQPMILTQDGMSVTGTMQGKDRLTKITGDIQGSKLSFTYDMLNGKGSKVASGSGFLDLSADGKSLSGVLMLNGLVISNIKATR